MQKISRTNECKATVLAGVSVAVKRHHDHGDSYNGENYLFFSGADRTQCLKLARHSTADLNPQPQMKHLIGVAYSPGV